MIRDQTLRGVASQKGTTRSPRHPGPPAPSWPALGRADRATRPLVEARSHGPRRCLHPATHQAVPSSARIGPVIGGTTRGVQHVEAAAGQYHHLLAAQQTGGPGTATSSWALDMTPKPAPCSV